MSFWHVVIVCVTIPAGLAVLAIVYGLVNWMYGGDNGDNA